MQKAKVKVDKELEAEKLLKEQKIKVKDVFWDHKKWNIEYFLNKVKERFRERLQCCF